jgi:diaminohydroxyphosphoribosylaminopyrimidine deaminase/5-amino-6-(5-phosphoribosylamino)uracil reductase
VREVVCALKDPFPQVNGKGIEQLLQGGIRVRVGILEEEARRLNEAWLCRVERGRPFVTLKMAASWDGKIGSTGRERGWFTSEAARREVHRMRSEADALLIGIKTALNDDPLLTVRECRPKRKGFPLRIVLDSQARLPLSSRLVQTARETPVMVACTSIAGEEKRGQLEAAGVQTVALKADDSGAVDLPSLLSYLAEREVVSLMVEGGAEVNWAFLERGLVDKVRFFLAPMIVGGKMAPTLVDGEGFGNLGDALRLVRTEYRRIGPDLMLTGWLH